MEQPARPAPAPLNVILVEPEIAANTGSIGRTCVAAGATLWLVRPLGFHLDDRHLRRAALDYWEHLDLRVVNSLDEAEQALGPGRLWYFSTKAKRAYTDAAFAAGDALVFGPETRGLPERLLERSGRSCVANSDSPRGPQLEPGERGGDRGVRGRAADRETSGWHGRMISVGAAGAT